MAARMETMGIGGHEYLAEKIFEKVKGLPKDLEMVELTKNEYDALTPAQKADPTKLYLVPGAGKYLKFQEISAEDYEALSQEEKMDPYTVYMTPGDGTYFRVIDITQEEYDALPEGEKTNPNNLYLIPGDDVEYLTKSVADTLYAGINDIPDVSGLLSKTEAASTYQTQSGMSSYLTSASAESTYATKSEAQIVSKNVNSNSPEFTDGVGGALLNKCIVHVKPIQDAGSDPPSPTNVKLINGHNYSEIRIGESINDPNYVAYRQAYHSVIKVIKERYPNFVTDTRGNNVVFGGDYDAINGTFTVTKIKYCFTGNETLTQGDYYSYPDIHYRTFKLTFPSITFKASTSTESMICTQYETWGGSSWDLSHNDLWCRIRNKDDYDNTACIFEWRHDDISSINEMKAYLEDLYVNALTPVAFVGTLTSPIVVKNIGKLPVRTLEGSNKLWLYLDSKSTIEAEYLTPSISGIAKNLENEITSIIVNCHEASEGDTGILVSDMSLFEMMDLIDNGYNITLRYMVEEYLSGNLTLTRRNVKMLKLEQYNHVYDTTGDPLNHDTISIRFSVQPIKGTTWYYEMSSNDGQDTLYLEKDFS